ncbi:hypothetical protein [Microbacterium timonense]|uniref:hypothetical protein n=1 Tax=Microbacterium timonense TaxID=2086576 RepID=UPI000D0FF919|nr:hypothetical protein [Microbacterium timonense]
MEPILLIVSSWWWLAPAAAGAGAATYAGLTTRSRRARRLELDAARHEESQTYRALVAAKARVRSAQADVLTAKSRPTLPGAVDARRELQAARQAEKVASLALRASRSRVKAGYAQYRATSSRDPLPIDRLYASHDAVNARWLAYETDVEKALAYPQMTDPRHPATVAFFQAQREALIKRPTLRDRVTPQQYVEYRVAVRDLEMAFDEAERRAGVPRAPQSAPGATAAAGLTAAAAVISELADRLPSLIARLPQPRNGQPPAGRVP